MRFPMAKETREAIYRSVCYNCSKCYIIRDDSEYIIGRCEITQQEFADRFFITQGKYCVHADGFIPYCEREENLHEECCKKYNKKK